MEIFRASGWKNQAEVARKLEMDTGAVSKIFSGTDAPSKRLIKYFRMFVFYEKNNVDTDYILRFKPGGETEFRSAEDLKLRQLQRRLAELQNENPGAFLAAEQVIMQFPKAANKVVRELTEAERAAKRSAPGALSKISSLKTPPGDVEAAEAEALRLASEQPEPSTLLPYTPNATQRPRASARKRLHKKRHVS